MLLVEHPQSEPFRCAMRGLAATVAVISAGLQGASRGMTAMAVTSVSTDPRSLLTCINRSASFHAILSSAEHFCGNLLGVQQADVSDAFAAKMAQEKRSECGTWRYNSPYTNLH
jgi:flavin reductase